MYTCYCLNHGVGGITDKMSIYKHVLKQTKNTVFLTLSVSAVVHIYSFSTVHIIKDQKKTQVSMIRKYHNHIPKTKTRPDIIMHFIKQWNQFHFERKLYVQKYVSVSVPFVPLAHGQFCCLLCSDDTLQVKSAILLMGHVAYDARFSVCNKRNYFEVQSQDKIIRSLVTSPFKSMYFKIFCKNYCRKTIEATTVKKVSNESKLIYAIYNFIVASWCLLFSYGSHLNMTTF